MPQAGGKCLDVYRRPQGLELDLLEYGNPTQHQRGRDKKLTYGDGGTCTHVPPSGYAPALSDVYAAGCLCGIVSGRLTCYLL